MSVRTKKQFGQHFLVDTHLIEEIYSLLDANLSADQPVLEIGPGEGILTKRLTGQDEFLALEIDQEAHDFLLEKEVVTPNQILLGDCLQQDWTSFFDKNYAVVGNFPYNISSQIVFKVLENRDNIDLLIGMFQDEVAKRITSKEGNKQYGIQSVLVQTYFEVNYDFLLPPEAFAPPPKVNSGVITLKRTHANDHIPYESLLKITKILFAQRRKTVRNNLKHAGLDLSQVSDELLGKRAEQLPKEVFWDLIQLLKR